MHRLSHPLALALALALAPALAPAAPAPPPAAPAPPPAPEAPPALRSGVEGLAALLDERAPYLIGDLGAAGGAGGGLSAWWASLAAERERALRALLDAAAPADRPALEALAARLGATRDLGELGLPESPAWLLYGLGLAPAALVELASPEALGAWLGRVLEGRAHGFERRRHPSGDYWRRAFQRWTLVARVAPWGAGGGAPRWALHAALLPKGAEPVLLSSFLAPPAAPLGAGLRARFAGLPADARPGGWLDLRALAAALLGAPPPGLKESAAAFGLPLPSALVGGCAADLERLTRGVTAVAFGARAGGGEALTHLTLGEGLRGLAAGLRADPASPRPLDLRAAALAASPAAGEGAAVHLDVSLRALGLVEVAAALDAWRDAPPWTCPLLKSLNRLTPARPGGLAAPLRAAAPLLAPLAGLSAHLSDLPGEGRAALSGWAELRYAGPQALVDLLRPLGALPAWFPAALPAPGAVAPLSAPPSAPPSASPSAPPSAWPAPALSASPRGVLLTLDASAAPLHALAAAPSAPAPAAAPPLLWLRVRPDAARAGIEALGVYRARLRALAQGDAAPPAAAPPAAAPSAPLPTAAGGGLSFDTLAVHVTSTGLLIEKRLAAP